MLKSKGFVAFCAEDMHGHRVRPVMLIFVGFPRVCMLLWNSIGFLCTVYQTCFESSIFSFIVPCLIIAPARASHLETCELIACSDDLTSFFSLASRFLYSCICKVGFQLRFAQAPIVEPVTVKG